VSNPLSRRLRTTLFYALRTAFRLMPMPQGTRDRLRQRFLDTRGHWVPEGPKGQAPTGDLPRRPYVRSDERAIGYVPYEKGELPDPLPATLVAFYLPQFHTIPENDEWWGKGFTEWRNVTRALPQFEGHYQPKLPGDLGFYDLRNVEVMHEQARLAREYGISAFCFYFYWFGGKTLLETPLRNWLNDKTIDLKFCLCWANEKWTRTWDGRGDEILIDQKHSPEDDIAFIEHVAEYMRDPRYLRVDGKPMLVVYRPGIFGNIDATARRWREYCRQRNIGEIHLAYVQSFEQPKPLDIGFDAAIEFPPNCSPPSETTGSTSLLNGKYAGTTLDWREMASGFLQRVHPDYTLHRGVNVGWDNEARRPGRGRTYTRYSSYQYFQWLRNLIPRPSGPGSALTFINAWNEWAEGAMLEPDARWGYANLAATRATLSSASNMRPGSRIHIVIHAWHLDVLPSLLARVKETLPSAPMTITTTREKEPSVREILVALQINAEVQIHENRGRDILPFLRAASRLILADVDWILKLHTKVSPHLATGHEWREELVNSLLPLDARKSIEDGLVVASQIGLVAADGHLLRVADHVGGNLQWLSQLAPRMSTDIESILSDRFPAGSMFWIRPCCINQLVAGAIDESDFAAEGAQKDGTAAHAIERLFGCATRLAGLETIEMHALIGRQQKPKQGSYPYAK